MVVDREKSSLNRQIDENLRRVYSQEADAEVPERFNDLLKRLREQEEAQGEAEDTEAGSDTGAATDDDGATDGGSGDERG